MLTQREEANAFRVLRPEADLIDFCSNDYLGLAKKGFKFEGNQIKTLKHKAQKLAPIPRRHALGQSVHLLAIQQVGTVIRIIQQPKYIE